jgi:hypothetical protein
VTGLTVLNEQRGLISVTTITQTGSKELKAETALTIQLVSANKIPTLSKLAITLPTNLEIASVVNSMLNGVPAETQVQPDTVFITVPASISDQTSFKVALLSGIFNPERGPYSLKAFAFEFQTDKGVPIDAYFAEDTYEVVSCDGLCSSCFPKLGHCEECGADVFTGVVSYLHEKTCLKDCPSGYFGNQQYRCQPCEFPCTECTIAPTLCTRCE